jgi:hypothetical protein
LPVSKSTFSNVVVSFGGKPPVLMASHVTNPVRYGGPVAVTSNIIYLYEEGKEYASAVSKSIVNQNDATAFLPFK